MAYEINDTSKPEPTIKELEKSICYCSEMINKAIEELRFKFPAITGVNISESYSDSRKHSRFSVKVEI